MVISMGEKFVRLTEPQFHCSDHFIRQFIVFSQLRPLSILSSLIFRLHGLRHRLLSLCVVAIFLPSHVYSSIMDVALSTDLGEIIIKLSMGDPKMLECSMIER